MSHTVIHAALGTLAGVALGVLVGVGVIIWQAEHSDDTAEGLAPLF